MYGHFQKEDTYGTRVPQPSFEGPRKAWLECRSQACEAPAPATEGKGAAQEIGR